MMKRDVTIIGAGMAGCLMALLLAKDGYKVEIFESQDNILKQPKISKRSINQSLGSKGVGALKAAGLWDIVKEIALPQTGRIIHQKDGSELYETYGQDHELIEWTVNRNELNQLLLRETQKHPAIATTFNYELLDVDLEHHSLKFTDTKTGEIIRKKASMLVGADGINSKVRQAMVDASVTNAHIDALPWGYKNILIKASDDAPVPFRNDAFHCWPCKQSSMVGMTNRGFFTCTLILPLYGPNSFETLNNVAALKRYFTDNYPDLLPYLDSFASTFMHSQPTTFRTLHTSKWFYQDYSVLIGDAAHAMTIFYGQGVNAAFDDCVTLARCIANHPTDMEAAFSKFQTLRKRNTEVIANLCLDRLAALKDRYSSPFFLARTHLEMKLEKLFPNRWMSEYTLMVHTDLPYADGLKRYEHQQQIARLLGLDLAVFTYGLYLLLKQKMQTTTEQSSRPSLRMQQGQ